MNTSNKKKVHCTYFEASNYCISPFGMLQDLANKKMKENSTLQNSIQFNYLCNCLNYEKLVHQKKKKRNSQLLLKVELFVKGKRKVMRDERDTLLRYECKGHL